MFKTLSHKQNTTVIFDQHKAELGQAKMRIWNVSNAIIYGHFSGIASALPPKTEAAFVF